MAKVEEPFTWKALHEQDAARDDRRILVEAALVPDAAAEVLVRRPPVPVHAVVTEVVEGVDVRAAVRVHVDRIAAVRVLLVRGGADAGEVVVDRPLRRVRHPDPVGRVAGRDPGRHADEVLDVQVEDVPAAQVFEDGLVRLRRDPVQTADLVVLTPGALRDLEPVLLEDRLRNQLVILDGDAHAIPPWVVTVWVSSKLPPR